MCHACMNVTKKERRKRRRKKTGEILRKFRLSIKYVNIVLMLTLMLTHMSKYDV